MNSAANVAPLDQGVLLNIEPYHEWQVVDIGFDGTERFKVPLSYSDHVAQLARKIDFVKIAGDNAKMNDPTVKQEKLRDREKLSKGKGKPKTEGRVPPEAGPWHAVAKNLHESLQQMNVLLDDLAIVRATEYMKPFRVADTSAMTSANQVEMQLSKSFQWISKRKALIDAGKEIDDALKSRLSGAGKQKDKFFDELRKLRQLYRVKKHGETIVGDLSYRIFGSKSENRGLLFDITRKRMDESRPDESLLQVRVSGDLARRSTLCVSIVRDNDPAMKMFPDRTDDNFAYMNVEQADIEKLPWEKALPYAQETLLCRDIFNKLMSEAVQLRRRMAVVKDGVVVVTIHDDYLLRIQLKFHPFTAETVPSDGDPFLTRFLREFHLAMECARPIRPRFLVDLPLTTLPESLDTRGPQAFTKYDVESRYSQPKGLLNRMTKVAAHYSLMRRTIEALTQHQIMFPEPSMKWRIIRGSPVNSLFLAEINVRAFEHIIGKVTYYVRVTYEGVTVLTKEGVEMACRRDESQLFHALHYMNAVYLIHMVNGIARSHDHIVLHCNMNAMNSEGISSPTLYLVNSMSTRCIFILFPLAHDPIVRYRKFIAEEGKATEEELSFTTLNFSRIPGTSLCKKFDNLFSILR